MLARKKLTADDVIALRTLPHVVAADGGYQHVGQFRVGDGQRQIQGQKSCRHHPSGDRPRTGSLVSDITLLKAALYTDDEDKRAAHVVRPRARYLGGQLFGDQYAVGKEVNVETGLYTVIGVLDKQKQPFGGGKNPNDNMAIFPLGTFHNLHPEDKDMWVSVKYDDPKNKALVQEEIRELLRIRRHVRVEAPDDFEIFGPDSLSKLWGQLTGGLVLFMIAVSASA
jgi:putative ABC transport system permease protein